MHLLKSRRLLPFAAVLLLTLFSVASAADSPGTPQASSKKRIDREKAFLLRGSDDLGRTLASVGETLAVLNEQVEAAKSREPENKAKERLGLLEWYQKYSDWLGGMAAEFDLEVSAYFSKPQADAGWTARFDELTQGYRRLSLELGGMMRKLEGEKKTLDARMQKLNTAVLERRILVDKDDLELARELWPAYRSYDRREAIYKDLSDAEVFYFQTELKTLGEQQKYFECLAELGNYEEGWLIIKADEFAKLQELARVIGGEEPGPVAAAARGMIRTYEADMAKLKRKTSELDAKIQTITRAGTFRMLDRLDELSRYYENMKNRYERHVEWLGVQVGSYQADLIELASR
jgi:hypothetical protein